MEKIIETFLQSPEAGFVLLKALIRKYKPMVYEVCDVLMDFYRDYASNEELPKLQAKIQKSKYDAYIEAGFSEDQALALMIDDNIQLMDTILKSSTQIAKVRK